MLPRQQRPGLGVDRHATTSGQRAPDDGGLARASPLQSPGPSAASNSAPREKAMNTENNSWMRVRSVAAGFLCVMGLPVALALADVQAPQAAEAPSYTESVPSMHLAQAGSDIGPGSDEALLAMSPAGR